jgi:hypothetical protein
MPETKILLCNFFSLLLADVYSSFKARVKATLSMQSSVDSDIAVSPMHTQNMCLGFSLPLIFLACLPTKYKHLVLHVPNLTLVDFPHQWTENICEGWAC